MAAQPSDTLGPGLARAIDLPPLGRQATASRWPVPPLEILLPALFLVALLFACFVWPELYHLPDPVNGSILNANKPPLSRGAVFGTDATGNDVLSRILYGGRTDLEVGFAVTGIGLVLGSLIGVVAGYLGGLVDAALMRILDIFIAFPALVLALAIADGLGPSELHVIWAISIFSVPLIGRLVRASALRLREQPFILSAKLSGTKPHRIIVRHLAPLILPQLVTLAMLGIGLVILLEGTLSFLGYGIPPPQPSWGGMIAAGENSLSTQAYLTIIPSAFLLATVIAFNVLSDGLRARWGVR
jgi:peptide/nickel transport system permease protein